MDQSDEQEELENQDAENQQILLPDIQGTITFHGKPLIVVRFPDGGHGVVLRWICENLHLGTKAQVQRIKRTKVIADGLVYARIQTDGGPQIMPTLVLNAVPYWLATIDTRRMEQDDPHCQEIFEYQRKAVDAMLRLALTVNGQGKNIRWAKDYEL